MAACRRDAPHVDRPPGDDAQVHVELLVVEDCPHEAAAASLLARAIQDVGLRGVPVVTTMIHTEPEAEQRHFPGSPTFLVNGRDPFVQADVTPALGCRIYETPDGLAGVPDVRSLRKALREAAAGGS